MDVDVIVAVVGVVVEILAVAAAAATTADVAAIITTMGAAAAITTIAAAAAGMISVPAKDAGHIGKASANGYWEGFNDASWGRPCGFPQPRGGAAQAPVAVDAGGCGCNN
mgnify:CR=1 FL=1